MLDNDFAPSGDRLTLVGDAGEGVPGELQIDTAADVVGDVGTALVSGRTVRYIAPDIEERDSFQVNYIAASSTGDTAPGTLTVIITPSSDPNAPPEPPTLEGRVGSGASIKVRLPGSGVDPDGDPVTVAGITSAPRLGRILSFGGNFLEYEAYPRTAGTDEFEYSVVDGRGGVATGVVRVAVVPLSEPQPPLAVSDQLTVEAGRTAVFDPLSNDYVAPGDEVRISLRNAPEGVRLDPETDLVSVPAPERTDGASEPIVYEITNGIDVSIATLEVNTAAEFENPPVVYDAFGQADDSGSVSVDVLEGAFDPDGDVADLRVTEVYGTAGNPTIDGDEVRVNRGPNPIVVPFRVEDANGAAATASLYVPPTGTGIPYVKDDALIELDEGGSASGRLADYIVNPSGRTLRLTRGTAVSASPAELDPARAGDDTFEVSAREGYRGPGAVLVEVTTASDAAGNEDPQDPTDGYTALLSIPVQVGDDVPVLECPQSTLAIAAGEDLDLDISSLCTVWTPDPADEDDLVFEGAWTQEVDGLSVDGNGTEVLRVSAATDANRGGEAVLAVTAEGSRPAEIRFRLASSPPPTLLPIRAEDMEAGQSRVIDLASYLEPGVVDPTPTVVSVEVLSGRGVSASRSGQSSVTLRASRQAQGRAVFRVVVSDVDDSSPGPGRRVEGRIEVDLAGLPGQPGEPRSYVEDQETGSVRLGWYPPRNDGGSPITNYVLKEMQSGEQRTCRTNKCDFPGLENRRKYNFRVAAVNKVGQGPWSELSLTAYADTKPGRVSNIRLVERGDHTVTIAWTKPESSTAIELYQVSWSGQTLTLPGSTTSYAIGGLDNNQKYVFSIEARNSVGWSPPRQSTPFQSVGTPASPSGLSVLDQQSGVQTTAVAATWTATAAEGPAPTLYTLAYTANGGTLRAVPGCGRIQATSCTHTGITYDGTNYNYFVQAHNVEQTSPPSPPVSFDAVGKPANWGAWSVTPHGQDTLVQVVATAPEPRGEQARAAILVAGQVVWEQNVRPGATINELVRTPGNEAAYPVQLRLCNENAARTGCTFTEPKAVQSYGSLRDEHLGSLTAQVDGLTVTWTITGTSNGDAAAVGISIDGGAEEVRPQTSPGAFSFTRTVAVADYGTTTSIRVRLFDDSPGGRGETEEYGEVESGPPPPPTVSLYKWASCDDFDSNGENNCSVNGFRPGCQYDSEGVNRCGYLGVRVIGARDDYTCFVVEHDDGPFAPPRPPFSRDTDDDVTTEWIFDSGRVGVTCSGGSGSKRFSVTSFFDWP